MGPDVKQDERVPRPGDTVHIVGHGPGVLAEIRSSAEPCRYLVKYPDGTEGLVSMQDILENETINSRHRPISPSSPRGPQRLLYLGRPFSDPGRNIRTRSATFSLVATMVGGGVLSLPYAVSQSGLALGTLALVLSGCASGWTLEMLVACARSTGRDTFELVGHAAFGEAGRKVTLTTVFVICWLSMIAYFVLIGDLLQPTAELVLPALTRAGSPDAVRGLVLCIAALVLSPMCFKNDLAALRFMCIASVGSVMLVSLIVTIRASESFGEAHNVEVKLRDGSYRTLSFKTDLRWWPEDWWQALYVFPMFGVSYLCHFNALPTHHELQRPTQFRMRRVVILTITFASVLYLAVGIFGFLFAGRCTCGNILLNFSASDKLVAVGRGALGLVLMLNFPLICQPCRNALFRVLSALPCCSGQSQGELGQELRPQAAPGAEDTQGTWVLTSESMEQSMQPLGSPLRSHNAEACGEQRQSMGRGSISTTASSSARVHVYRREDAQGNLSRGTVLEACDIFAPKDETVQQSAAEPSRLQTCVLTVLLLVSALLVSCFLRSILVVWSILGSTVAFLVSFILPALFWYRIVGNSPTTSACHRCAALVLLVASCVLGIVCTILTCIHLSAPPCPVTTAVAALS